MQNSKWRFRVPSPALTVACLALAVALSGVGYAAVTLPRNSVGTAQLKKGAVNSVKVKDRSLQGVDFAVGQLPAGPQGQQGPPGPPNPNAVNSDMLDNLDSTAFLPAAAKAADADTLDGMDSLVFVRGNGLVYSAAFALIPRSNPLRFLGVSDFFDLDYECPFSPSTSNGFFRLGNQSSSVMNVFVDNGGTNPTYYSLDAGIYTGPIAAVASGESFDIKLQGAGGIATVDVAIVHRESGCHVQASVVHTLP